MKKSYGKGLAIHIDPESCGAAREGGVEALTGERAGRVFSRVRNFLRDADAVGPQDYCFCALLASARSLIRSNWCFHNRSNVLVHSCNGRIAIAFTL